LAYNLGVRPVQVLFLVRSCFVVEEKFICLPTKKNIMFSWYLVQSLRKSEQSSLSTVYSDIIIPGHKSKYLFFLILTLILILRGVHSEIRSRRPVHCSSLPISKYFKKKTISSTSPFHGKFKVNFCSCQKSFEQRLNPLQLPSACICVFHSITGLREANAAPTAAAAAACCCSI
jgi:hypothetical protein